MSAGKRIERVAVIGAGVMGAGIAAHVANAGVPVTLLDIVPEGRNERSALATDAVQNMLKADPAPFMHKRNAKLIQPGNLEDDLGQLEQADWIIEAVVERLDIKRELYARIDKVRKPGSIVSSNTSTIPLHALIDGMSERFAADFLIAHFFNPPRYMRLLELVVGPQTRSDARDQIADFCDQQLGKGVVACNDTPGFIANRIGVYWLQCAVSEAIRLGVSVEEADALIGAPMGVPKSGVFGLLDLVGLDLMPHVVQSLDASLPEADVLREYFVPNPLIEKMIADGYTGRKGKGGFYRLNRSNGKRLREAIDLRSGEYHPVSKPSLDAVKASRKSGLRGVIAHPSEAGQYAWTVVSKTLCYAADLVPEIADRIDSVDQAMRLGYNWKHGPFELMDRIGADWFAERLAEEGRSVPALLQRASKTGFYRERGAELEEFDAAESGFRPVIRAPGAMSLADFKRGKQPIERNASASLWDLGDGVICAEFHSKMNALDPQVLALLRHAIELIGDGSVANGKEYRALVVHNDAENFSVGVNLGLALFALNIAAWDEVESIVRLGQETYAALRDAPFPVVAAPGGMALGGGCELLLHCDAVVAHAETYTGLVEAGVGLVPGWGGCSALLSRWYHHRRRPAGPMPALAKAFEAISTATVARSAQEARDWLFLRAEDEIVMNRDRLLPRAKQVAIRLLDDYQVAQPQPMHLPGATAAAALGLLVDNFLLLGRATPHDAVVARGLARILSGGATDISEPITQEDVLALERQVFLDLCKHPATLARIEHMMETGRPLRN